MSAPSLPRAPGEGADVLPPKSRRSSWGWLWLMLLVLLPATGGVASFSHFRALGGTVVDLAATRSEETRDALALSRAARTTERALADYVGAPTPANRRALDKGLADLVDRTDDAARGERDELLLTPAGALRVRVYHAGDCIEALEVARRKNGSARDHLASTLDGIPAELRDSPVGSVREGDVESLRRLAARAATASDRDQLLDDPARRAFDTAAERLRAGPLTTTGTRWIAQLASALEARLAAHDDERRAVAERAQANLDAQLAFANLHRVVDSRVAPRIDRSAERLQESVRSAHATAGRYLATFTLLGLLAGAAAVIAFSRSEPRKGWMGGAGRTPQPDVELEDLGTAFNRMVENLAHSESLLREKEARLRMILETAADGIVTINQFGAIESYNAKAKTIFGYREVEVLGKCVSALLPAPFDAPAPELEEYLRTGVRDLLGRVRQVEGRRRDGTTFPMEMVVSEARVNNRTTFTAIVRDITVRRTDEERQAKLIKELESKNAEMERFTYTVSHDLKSPLITIRGFLGLLERDMESGNRERVRADLEHIDGAVANMQELLSQLLELSRVGRIVNEPAELDLLDLIRQALDRVAGRLREADVQVTLDELPVVVMGDGVRLTEVFQNLFENAVKFMGPDNTEPRIWVRLEEFGGHVECVVEDNGMGIDPRYHERVFGLFERLDPSSEGTGIGLALVKRIVELHGGSIHVESEGAGQGARFCVRLPKKGRGDRVDD